MCKVICCVTRWFSNANVVSFLWRKTRKKEEINLWCWEAFLNLCQWQNIFVYGCKKLLVRVKTIMAKYIIFKSGLVNNNPRWIFVVVTPILFNALHNWAQMYHKSLIYEKHLRHWVVCAQVCRLWDVCKHARRIRIK